MARYIPTKCQMCGSDMFLVQPAVKEGETKSVARGKCLKCEEVHEYTILLNPDWNKNIDVREL